MKTMRQVSWEREPGQGEREAETPLQRVFEHWVKMLCKNARRVAMGPSRRKVIERALGLYDEDMLLMAIEGLAASRWHAGDNDRGRPFDDIELCLRDEAHIERFAAEGEALRQQVLREQAAVKSGGQVLPMAAADPAAVAAGRDLVRAAAARAAGRKVPHG